MVGAVEGEFWPLAELDGMMLGQELRRPTLNGFSGNAPYGFILFAVDNQCAIVVRRISGYAVFAKLDAAAYRALLQRVVPVRMRPCDWPSFGDGPQRPHAGPLAAEVYGGISLTVQDVRPIAERQVIARLNIANRSPNTLPAGSSTDTPVRISWRLRDVGKNSPLSGWDERRDLDLDVLPGKEAQYVVKVHMPKEQGLYQLEFSMVQEKIVWFHDRGMAPAASEALIKVGPGGDVSIVRNKG
jgi:hypothetical protein